MLQSNFTHQVDKQRWPEKDFEVMVQIFWCDFFNRSGVLFLGTRQTKPLVALSSCRGDILHYRESHILFSYCFLTDSHLGTYRCAYTWQDATRSCTINVHICCIRTSRQMLLKCCHNLFWKSCKVFCSLWGKGVMPEISESESLNCFKELRLFSFISFQTQRVQISTKTLGKVVLLLEKCTGLTEYLWVNDCLNPFRWVSLKAAHYNDLCF